MSKQSHISLQEIPAEWITSVLAILRAPIKGKIVWTVRAKQDWQQIGEYGFESDAYVFLISELGRAELLGERIYGMQDSLDGSECDTWAFLCKHPAGDLRPVYVKLGLHGNLVRLSVFSIHIDLTGKLARAYERLQKRKK